MKADTFAKLLVLETLVEAEIGSRLEWVPQAAESFREAMIAEISDLVDEIDALDAVTAGRVYDALVDFLAELPEHDAGIVEATVRFNQSLNRIAQRGMQPADLAQAATWAVAADELLTRLLAAYRELHGADAPRPRVRARVEALLARTREVVDRMLWAADRGEADELRRDLDRLTFAIRYQQLDPAAVELLIRVPRQEARRLRPSTVSRIGAFVLGHLLRRRPRGATRPA